MKPALRLTATAFVMLFVELALIRWLGATVVYLAYFSNVVLLGSFLGIGLGFLWAGRSGRSSEETLPRLLARRSATASPSVSPTRPVFRLGARAATA